MTSEQLQLILNVNFYFHKIYFKRCMATLVDSCLFCLSLSHGMMPLKCKRNFYKSFRTGGLLFNTCFIKN